MLANLTATANLKPEKQILLRRTIMKQHEITSEMVCAFIRHEWNATWKTQVKNLLVFSQETGIDYANLRKIIKDGAVWNITLPTINRIAAFMGISTAKFFTEVEEFSKK